MMSLNMYAAVVAASIPVRIVSPARGEVRDEPAREPFLDENLELDFDASG